MLTGWRVCSLAVDSPSIPFRHLNVTLILAARPETATYQIIFRLATAFNFINYHKVSTQVSNDNLINIVYFLFALFFTEFQKPPPLSEIVRNSQITPPYIYGGEQTS